MMRKTIITVILACLSLGINAQQKAVYLDQTKRMEERVEDALARMTLDEKIAIIHAQSKFSAPGVKRLGIPDLWTDDGPHGVRPDVIWDEWRQAGQTNDSCVAFPALTCLAATWNTQMAHIYGTSLAEEALYRKKNVMLAPGVNIYRTPLCGRNFEYMGEDPFLTSTMVVPYIKSIQEKGVAACVKHYALNNDEEYRHQVNVIVSDRALHEIYLPAFKAAVTKAGVWSVMGAYNLYQNQHNCHNYTLLQKILKQDWQFDGVLVSDWGGCHDTEEAVVNGLDLEFGTGTDGLRTNLKNAYDRYYLAEVYKQLIKQGRFTTKELDDKVRRVLRLHLRTTMNRNRELGFLCSESHYDAALTIAQEGIVLLKNDRNILPLQAGKRILVVGENAIKMMTIGGGSSSLKVQHEILPLDGIKARFASSDVDYARGYVGQAVQEQDGMSTNIKLNDSRSDDELIAEAVQKAQSADYVIFVGGLNKADYQDCEGHDRKDFSLPYNQDRVIDAIAAVNPNIVYVNVSGNAAALPWLSKVPAVVQAWFLGSEAGKAIASVLAGDVNPSGKLPFTWHASLNDVGAHALNTYPGTWREDHKVIDEEYKEGIYVGYRWVEKKKIRPLFAFGHGLSYTSFDITAASLDKTVMTDTDSLNVSVTVRNTGNRAGAEVVQLYITDVKCSVDRPVKELKGFRKVFLQPGEEQTIVITIGKDALSFYDENASSWRAEPGLFIANIGTSSDRIVKKLKFSLR